MTILGADEGRLRALLDSLGYDLEPSILIGGWATNARVGGEISHDIDLIITIRTCDSGSRNASPSTARTTFTAADGKRAATPTASTSTRTSPTSPSSGPSCSSTSVHSSGTSTPTSRSRAG